MKGDPLTATFEQDELESTKAQTEAAAMAASHSAVVRRAGIAASKKVNEYTAAVNGFSVLASHEQAQKLAKDPNVLLVIPDELQQPQSKKENGKDKGKGKDKGEGKGNLLGGDQITDKPGESIQKFLGVDEIWEEGNKGEGQLIGVIDSGIWPEHPSFADDGTYPPVVLKSADFDACDFGNTAANPADAEWTCNNKLVGARQMLATYRAVVDLAPGEFDSARDDDGHGTHTASTAAGNEKVRAWIYDKKRTLDYTSGIAPRSQIIAYKGLGSLGGFSSDLAKAIDQAVTDGVDVINYSIGGGPGLNGQDALAFLFATGAGVHVATSAGNSGPGDTTIGGPADLPWVTTVGASTHPRFYSGTIQLGNGTKLLGSSVTLGTKKLPLVDAADLGNELCLSEEQLEDPAAWARFDKGADGAIVLCWRGQIGRSIKSFNVKTAGGKAMILSNVNDVDNYFTDNFRLPTVMVDGSEGNAIAAYIDSGKKPWARLTKTGEIKEFAPAPSMAGFSSRGPNPSAPSIIKPDITAPGVQVLAGASPAPIGEDYEPGQLFQAISGTSMSSPVMAGVFLLLNKEHPEWSPAAMKSAVMTTAFQDVRDNDRKTLADPFDFGNGHVDADPAFDPGLVYDAGFDEYLGFLCGSSVRNDVFGNPDATCGSLEAAGVPTTIENHNYPSIGISAVAGTATVERTVTNVSGKAGEFKVTVEDPEGMDVTVSPSTLRLADGESATYEVTVTNVDAPVNTAWVFGSLTWSGPGSDVRSSIAAYPTPFDAPTMVTGSGASESVSIPVKVGFEGTYTADAGGLAANVPQTGTVEQDAPDKDFAPLDPAGTTQVPITMRSVAYARWSYVLDTDDDIDLYLYKDGVEVASSTAGGTNELIELSHPEDGNYVLYVHGYTVVGGLLDFSIDQWLVQSAGGTPELIASPSTQQVVPGDVVDVTASWEGAADGVSFGVVDHLENGTFGGQTVVQVTAP